MRGYLARFLGSVFAGPPGTILIAEPDQVLRECEYSALSDRYRIVQTSSVEEAVRTAARHKPAIDLLLTEVRLPEGSGSELMELLKLDYPNLKVIYMSSSIDDDIRTRSRRAVFFVLMNPFNADRLRQAVREALETGPNGRVAAKSAA